MATSRKLETLPIGRRTGSKLPAMPSSSTSAGECCATSCAVRAAAATGPKPHSSTRAAKPPRDSSSASSSSVGTSSSVPPVSMRNIFAAGEPRVHALATLLGMTIRLVPLGALLLLLLGPACQTGMEPAAATTPAPAPAPTPTPAPAPKQDPIARLIALAQKDNRVMQHLRHLTKDIGPRLTGSEHYDRAAQWCLEQFQSWGLDARLETWGEFPVRCDRGVQRGRELKPEPRDLVLLTSAWTHGTQGLVRARACLEPADEAELEAHKQEYAGAWIVRRSKRPVASVRKALDAALEAKPAAGFVRSFGGELLQMGGRHDRTLEQIEKLPLDVFLRGDQYEAIVASLEQGQPVELEFEIENRLVAGPAPC